MENEPYRVVYGEGIQREIPRLADDKPELLEGLRSIAEKLSSNPGLGTQAQLGFSEVPREMEPLVGRKIIRGWYSRWIGELQGKSLYSLNLYFKEKEFVAFFNPQSEEIDFSGEEILQGEGRDIKDLNDFEVKGWSGDDKRVGVDLTSGVRVVHISAEGLIYHSK